MSESDIEIENRRKQIAKLDKELVTLHDSNRYPKTSEILPQIQAASAAKRQLEAEISDIQRAERQAALEAEQKQMAEERRTVGHE